MTGRGEYAPSAGRNGKDEGARRAFLQTKLQTNWR
jgi:hypothetical protein